MKFSSASAAVIAITAAVGDALEHRLCGDFWVWLYDYRREHDTEPTDAMKVAHPSLVALRALRARQDAARLDADEAQEPGSLSGAFSSHHKKNDPSLASRVVGHRVER